MADSFAPTVLKQCNQLDYETTIVTVRECQDCLRKGNKPLRQLSNMALALNMWQDVNEWELEDDYEMDKNG